MSPGVGARADDGGAPGQARDALHHGPGAVARRPAGRGVGGIGHDHDAGADDRIDVPLGHRGLEPFDGPRLSNVQRLAGRDPPRGVDQAHGTDPVAGGQLVRQRPAELAGPDNRDPGHPRVL